MRLCLNESISIPRPLMLDENTGNMRPTDKVEYSVTPPELASFDPDASTATGLMVGEGSCTIIGERAGVRLSKTVAVVVPAPKTVEVQVPVPVPGESPPFSPTVLIVPGE